jgi:hypothetical protein
LILYIYRILRKSVQFEPRRLSDDQAGRHNKDFRISSKAPKGHQVNSAFGQ